MANGIMDMALGKIKQPTTVGPAAFVATLLHGVTAAHMLHLQTKSYAHHMALNTLYDELGELVDVVAEEYQGCNGVITTYPAGFTPPADPIAYVQGLYDFIEQNRMAMTDESHIQNNIDAICTLLASTLYKLRYLA